MCVLHIRREVLIVLLFSLLRSDFLCSGLRVMLTFVITVEKVRLTQYLCVCD
jgi:hypothetical protein